MQNKSCLQHKTCLRTKTENPNAYYNTLMNIFECSQKSARTHPTPYPSPLRSTVLTQRLVSGHVYEVNMAIAP